MLDTFVLLTNVQVFMSGKFFYDYSSISAILSTVVGVHFGHVLIHMKVKSKSSRHDHLTNLQHSY